MHGDRGEDRESMLCANGQQTIIVIGLLYQEIKGLSDVCLIFSESITTIVDIHIFHTKSVSIRVTSHKIC
jgi:hypothetical protein